MRVRKPMFVGGVCAGVALLASAAACSQQPPAGQPPANQSAPQTAQVHGNLAQVMRGIIYPASNVVFFAQSEDPAAVKPETDPSTSPNPLSSSYGGWEAAALQADQALYQVKASGRDGVLAFVVVAQVTSRYRSARTYDV